MQQIGSEVAVFSARSGLRRKIVRFVGGFATFALLAIGAQFLLELGSVPEMEPIAPQNVITITALNDANAEVPAPVATPKWVYDENADASCETFEPLSNRRIMAFLPSGDTAAQSALTKRCNSIDIVLQEAFRVTDVSGSLQLRSDPLISGLGPRTLPTLQISSSLNDNAVLDLLSAPGTLGGIAFRLEILSEGPRAGLCLDLTDQPALRGEVVEKAVRQLVPNGLRCVIGLADAAFWEDDRLVETLDLAVVHGFRASSSPADPPAPAVWFLNAMAHVESLIAPEKLVVSLGTRGQSWRSGTYGVQATTFVETMAQASATGATVSYVPWANAVRSRYVDTTGKLTETWAIDALSIHKQLEIIGPDVAVAVWPLGAEDPAIWGILQGDQAAQDVLTAPINLDSVVQVEGEGLVISSATPMVSGQRVITKSDDGQSILSETYLALPVAARLVRDGDNTAGISVSFSDLPPKSVWPTLSDILSGAGIEATFLVAQRDLVENAQVAQRIVTAGHTLGFQQENGNGNSPLLDRIADSTRQLLLADRAGIQARIVEAGEPGDWSGLARNADRLIKAGYMPVVPTVEYGPSTLWSATETIRANWYSQTDQGDRIAIRAGPNDWDGILINLPLLLGELQQQGYAFRSIREAANLTHTQAMPAAGGQLHVAAGVVFSMVDFALNELNVIFFWFLVYSAIRSAIYLGLSIARRPKRDYNPDWTPPVTVLIPAFNEEKVIESCIRSILSSPYPNLKVIVVDDGSTDNTYDVANRSFGTDPRVKILRQPNGGKWAAANHALSETDTPFFLIADADSVFTPETIGWLMQQFQDERVGAVAGIVEVGNRGSLLGNCQALEYVVSQSIIRRAQEVFEGILVVPGAVGAWRTEAVRKAGLFSGNTVTEDADLTVAVHRAGYRVTFQEQARSVTEAPSSARDFMRQRLRWTFGMLQTSWKHRATIREGRTVGYISIIDAIWFGVASSIFAPLVDFLLLVLVLQGAWAVMAGGTALIASVPIGLVLAYFALTTLDILNTLVAFWFEKRFDWRLLLLVPVLRFGYRQLLYISTIRALIQALTGTVAGWNKLDRTGSVLSLWSREKRQV